jgi:dipeptide/tripeptide permease
MALLAVTSIPLQAQTQTQPVGWVGPLIGLVLVAIGTGGIKPCVSSLGGDQFTESQKESINAFYNYFYMVKLISLLMVCPCTVCY